MRILFLLLALTCLPMAYAETNLKTLHGETLALPAQGWTHLVFFDLWASYGDSSARQTMASLPASFNQQATTIWIQPRMNVTDAQLRDFQQQFPEVQPLVIDEGFELMRHYGLWQLPAHVILHDGETVFRGFSNDMKAYVQSLPAPTNKKLTTNHKAITP